MTCHNAKSHLEELLLSPQQAPQAVREHLAACDHCRHELAQMQATLALLDEWQAPAANPYFTVRMQARLREEQQARPAGWLERLRLRVLYGNRHLRPLAAGAFALALLLGGGAYAGIETLASHQAVVTPQSATLRDLQSLDQNAQVFQQLNALDGSGDGSSGSM
jgi:anti-sigma factor RsiW